MAHDVRIESKSAGGFRSLANGPVNAGRAKFDVSAHVTAAEALQAAGVPAAPVLQNWELISDNHLHDRDFFVKTRHP